MTFFSILETLLIGPLKLLFEIIFAVTNRIIGHPGLSIIALSLIMNILVLPLYRRADAMQEEARDTDAKLRRGVDHIKKTFSGDERMMILQTYYRQNNYRPTDALNGSVSLLLEIPFFMAAYQFLSNLAILDGVAFGPIRDLGAPDGLLVIGGLAINLLPILMTAINCISSALYLKGFPLKTKVQLYGMALFFLVFLYNSPSCLVFYWTLNNLFSLVKTIFYKLKNPRKILRYLCAALGLVIVAAGLVLWDASHLKRKVFLVIIGLVLLLFAAAPLLGKWVPVPNRKDSILAQSDGRVFWLGALFLAVLTGALIPSTVIAASPQEFVDVSFFYHPLWYIASSLCLSCGTFLIWMSVFYWLADSQWKVLFQRLILILCGVMLVDYMFFGTNLGTLSTSLQYEKGVMFSMGEQLMNLLVLLAVALLLYLFFRKFSRSTVTVLLTALIAVGGMSAVNVVQINRSVNDIHTESPSETIRLPLSQTGKNVVILMLDRAMGEYVPFLFNEKPELVDKFDGFTYYPNTISYGLCTNLGIPALLGGYEYTPVEMNKRSSEPLVSKHNEALKVMPTLFADNGYRVTVCDPTYANYQWIPDLSIYDDDPRIQAYNTKGVFLDDKQKAQANQILCRNFFVFSMMKSAPLCLQGIIYLGGNYNHLQRTTQTCETISKATGVSNDFLNPYYVLKNLPEMTEITGDAVNTFLYLANDTTHEPMLLQEPDYIPAEEVDNTAFDEANAGRFTVDGKTLRVENVNQMIHYQSNMATMLVLADWFDYLRENNVYDNTRIILVSDHGRGLEHMDEFFLEASVGKWDLEYFYPLLLVKDFDSHGFTSSEVFMTNADVPTMATEKLIENPTNPFTGKPINSQEKTAHDQFISLSSAWKTEENCGNTFLPAYWASISGNPWDVNSWTVYDKKCALDRHAAP